MRMHLILAPMGAREIFMKALEL